MTTRMDFRPAPLHRRTDYSRWLRRGMVFIICVVTADSLLGDRGLAARARAIKDHEQTQAAVRQLKLENAALGEQVRRYRDDRATLEAFARQELGMIRRGELLIRIKP